jgi:hypothetical protein
MGKSTLLHPFSPHLLREVEGVKLEGNIQTRSLDTAVIKWLGYGLDVGRFTV